MITASFAKSALRTGSLFGLFMGVFFTFIFGIIPGISSGLIVGAFFGLIMATFVKYQSSKFVARRPTFANETFIEEGPANHFLNGEGVGGWLYLTDKHLLFKSHAFNVQTHELPIRLCDIERLTVGKSLGLISNQLHVRLADGTVEHFVVNRPKTWIREIRELITVGA